MARRSAVLTVLSIAAVIVLVDQLTKAWAVATLEGQPPVEVLGRWLQWSFATNSGAAFSFGSGNAWIFTIIAGAIVVFVLVATTKVTNLWWALAMGLILGGGTGNLVDRIFRPPGVGQGAVVSYRGDDCTVCADRQLLGAVASPVIFPRSRRVFRRHN